MSIILNLTWAVVLLPLLGVGASFLAESPRRAAHTCLAITGLAFAASLVVLVFRLTHHIPSYQNLQTFWDLPGTSMATSRGTVFPADFLLAWGIRVDPLSISFMALVLFLSLAAQVHALLSARGDDGYRRFFWVSCVLTFGLLVLVSSPNLFQFLLGWEVVAVAAWMFVAHHWRVPSIARMSTRAFLLLRLGDAALLLAVAFTYAKFAVRVSQQAAPPGFSTADPLAFSALDPLWHLARTGAVTGVGGRSLVALAVLFVAAAAARAALGPLHLWLTAAAEAPVPGLGLVAVAGPLCAVLLLARVYPLLVEATTVLSVVALVGAVAAVGGAVLALVQRDLLRVGLFAVSSQAGLVIATLGMGGYSPALFTLFTGSVLTLLFFLSAGTLTRAFGTRQLNQMGGAWTRMPGSSRGLLAWALGISGLSLNTYRALAATFHNAVPGGGAASPAVQLVVGLCALVTTVLTGLFAGRAFLQACAGVAARRRGFDATRIRETDPAVRRTITAVLAAAVVATLVGLPGLTFGHFIYGGASRQQLPFDLVALLLVFAAGAGGLGAAWMVYAPQRRTSGERVRVRFGTFASALAAGTPAERAAPGVARLLGAAGSTVAGLDAQLLGPLLDSPADAAATASPLLGRVRLGGLGVSLAVSFAVVSVALAVAVLAVTGHFPVVTR